MNDMQNQKLMKTLILNVDRDDDLGRKAKVKSPIIGLNDNIEAANKLGIEDPEDSDLNALFSAISTYKKYKTTDEKEIEIATICGHINVGLKSDEILAKQLEDVIKITNAQELILITDGAEDENILPIIQSRIKITSIKRVSVKQSRELEDTYYRILKLLNDEKVQKQFVLPISLVLIVWAVFVLLNIASSGFGAILLTLGIYLLIRVFRWERNISYIASEVKSGFLTGKLSIYTYIIAGVILIATIFVAYNNSNFTSEIELIPILSFLSDMIWGIVLSGLLIISGRIIDIYVKDKKAPWNYWIAPFSLFAFGFISTALIESLYNSLINWPNTFSIEPFLTLSFIGNTSTGIMIAIVGAVTYHYIKEIYSTEKSELEIEKQTT
jgi:putative membrane protein